MTDYPAFRASIIVNGKHVDEIDDPKAVTKQSSIPGDGPKIITKYIQCVEDTQFSVLVGVNNEYDFTNGTSHSLSLAVYIDGQWVRSPVCRARDTRDQPWEKAVHCRLIRGPDGNVVFQAFQFKSLNMGKFGNGDAGRVHHDRIRAKHMGNIQIQVHRIVEHGLDTTFPAAPQVGNRLNVAGKSLNGNALAHPTYFANSINASHVRPPNVKCSRYPGDTGPIAIFQFLYRSKGKHNYAIVKKPSDLAPEILIEEGIVPRPRKRSNPFSVESIRIEDLTNDQVKQLYDRVKKIRGDDKPNDKTAIVIDSDDESVVNSQHSCIGNAPDSPRSSVAETIPRYETPPRLRALLDKASHTRAVIRKP
ncbi:putative C2 NT-type domain-containing protein [Seiridium cardinale]|uniref:C2 NT-type domain-containing protein n=1 Tax=Seiridium cardinale TaxID=138064 RepID=A0ABR2XYG0_9PEZI